MVLYRTWKNHHGMVVATAGDYDIITCESCGFRHVIPLPTAEDMAATYAKDYYTQEKPNFLAEATEDQRWATLMQQDRLIIFEDILGTERRTLLDIGSGPGFFLVSAMTRGWRARGVEPSHAAAEFARKNHADVVENFFNAETAPSLGAFDVVHMNNVLEHIPDPISLIKLARDCITPGGLICINVPNDFTPVQAAARDAVRANDWWVAPPHHLNYFDFASLSALLERLGFTILVRTTSFPMEMFLLMGDNYVGHGDLGRACHKKRMSFDLNLEAADAGKTRRAFYRALASAGIGREVVLIAEKKQEDYG